VPGRLGSFVIAAATALVILGASILPFASPVYVRFEQDRTSVPALTQLEPLELDHVTTSILGDLFLWQGDFTVGGPRLLPILNEREQAHMRDVRGVFAGFELLVFASIVALVLAFRRYRETVARAAAWRAVGKGARGLMVGLVVAGAFAVLAFDAAFEVFHRLFFSAGSYTFDPRTDRLVQLFPEQFWSETAIAVGVVAIVAGLLVAWWAARRARSAAPAAVLTASRVRP
jgi:integral membrane protein (TIGR01906 family)